MERSNLKYNSGRTFKIANRRKRPTSAIVATGTSAYLES